MNHNKIRERQDMEMMEVWAANAVVKKIHEALECGDVREACRLAREGHVQFPDDECLAKISRILAPPKVVCLPWVEKREEDDTEKKQFEHDWVSPPGDTISDILKERDWKKAELAERLGVTEQYINEVLKGTASITPALAQRLEHSFGAPAKFWLKREANYQKKIRGEK